MLLQGSFLVQCGAKMTSLVDANRFEVLKPNFAFIYTLGNTQKSKEDFKRLQSIYRDHFLLCKPNLVEVQNRKLHFVAANSHTGDFQGEVLNGVENQPCLQDALLVITASKVGACTLSTFSKALCLHTTMFTFPGKPKLCENSHLHMKLPPLVAVTDAKRRQRTSSRMNHLTQV